MEERQLYALSADILLVTHALFVAFVVFGLLLILLGRPLAWAWVRNPWFRWAHLIAIGTVVLQSWMNLVCPLTTWEMALRERAGDIVYTGSFVSHWVASVLYYQAPEWFFTLLYTAFGATVLVTWFWVPPRSLRGLGRNGEQERQRRD